MVPRMDPRAEGSTIHRLPQAFITKKGEAILIRTLDERTCDGLLKMYLDFQPRNSFQGLPPITDKACTAWVHHMIGNGINLVALSFAEGVAGHTALFPINDEVCEMLVVVSPRLQNTGIGTQLTRCSVQLAYEIGFERMWLPVEAINVRARHVYKKCGFEYLNIGDDHELEMALDLKRYHDVAKIEVARIMNMEVIAIRADEPCRVALDIFLRRRVASLPVIDERGELTGILSESDLMLPSNIDKNVGDVQTRDVLTVREQCTIGKLIRMFESKKVRCIPVVDDQRKLIGIVGRKDVLAYYSKHL